MTITIKKVKSSWDDNIFRKIDENNSPFACYSWASYNEFQVWLSIALQTVSKKTKPSLIVQMVSVPIERNLEAYNKTDWKSLSEFREREKSF